MALDVEKLKHMGPDELDKEARGLRNEIWKLRIQKTTGQLQDHHQIRRTRKDLARVLTRLSEVRRGS